MCCLTAESRLRPDRRGPTQYRGSLLRSHSLTSRAKAQRCAGVYVCVSVPVCVRCFVRDAHSLVCRCICKQAAHVNTCAWHPHADSGSTALPCRLSLISGTKRRGISGENIRVCVCFLWICLCLWERQSQSTHCSPLQSATAAPWVVSEWFGHPLCHLSPPALRLTAGPATRHWGPASIRLLSHNQDWLFFPTGDFSLSADTVIFYLSTKTLWPSQSTISAKVSS